MLVCKLNILKHGSNFLSSVPSLQNVKCVPNDIFQTTLQMVVAEDKTVPLRMLNLQVIVAEVSLAFKKLHM